MLALIAQQITIPAYLFAKIIYCRSSDGGHNQTDNADNNEFVCPSVADRIGDLWMLLLWPFYVVLCGLISGYIVAKLSNTPPNQQRACMAAIAFPNSTGLAITLLSVIHKQFSSSAELGKIDPIAFLSVYLLLYPVLQWGLGGWLLAPTEEIKHTNYNNNDESENSGIVEANPLLRSALDSTNTGKIIERKSSLRIPHVLNYKSSDQKTFGRATKSSSATLDSMVKELSFGTLHDDISNEEDTESNFHIPGVLIPQPGLRRQTNNLLQVHGSEEFRPTAMKNNDAFAANGVKVGTIKVTPSEEQIRMIQRNDVLPLTETLLRILRKVLQPPVTWSLIGLFIASFPSLRGILVNIWGHRGRQAPLQFVYDGIYTVCWQLVDIYLYCTDDFYSNYPSSLCLHTYLLLLQVGQSAIPINMMILGINLSSTFQKKANTRNSSDEIEFSNRTMIAVVIGKMLLMPIIGILSTWFLEHNYTPFPDEIDATCYLVMMIVFITPTANNVMIMVELSGSSSKEGMARLIGWQYAVSPFVLSLVLSVVVSLASCHFDSHSVCELH